MQDFECSVLGAALKSAEAHTRVISELTEEDFATPAHKTIFNAMCRVHEKGKGLDPLILADELGPELVDVGGIKYLTELLVDTITATNVENHIEAVRELSKKRLFYADMKSILNGMKEGEEEYLEKAQKAIERAQGKVTTDIGLIGDYALEAFTEICEGKKRGIDTGFVTLDQTLGGLNKGHVCVVAGRPSMGKTSFAANIAANIALRGKSVAFFSLEQPRTDIIKRMLISQSGCTAYDAYKGHSGPLAKLAESLDVISKWNMAIIDDAYTLDKIRENCYRLKRKTKAIDLIVIDYLGMIKPKSRKGGTREQEVSDLSRNIKLLAREMDCPVILLAQLNRDVEKRTDRMPIMADLRDSGAIEQDADEILFLYRPAVYNPQAGGEEAIIKVAKNRNGKTGEIDAKWDGEHFTYTDAEFEEVSAVKWEEL